MTTPTPPPGMRIIPSEYLRDGHPLPLDAVWITKENPDDEWEPCSNYNPSRIVDTPYGTQLFAFATAEDLPCFAIPIHPATGDAVGFIPKKERERLNKVIQNISEHAKPVEQRQELPIPEAHYSCGGSCREDRSLPADDLAWFPRAKLWLCCECSEDKEEVGDAEITLEDYLKTRK